MKNFKLIAIIMIAAIVAFFCYRAYQQQQQKNMIIQPPCLPGFVIGEDDTNKNNICVKA